MTDADVEMLVSVLRGAIESGQKVSVPAERVLEIHGRLLVAWMERDEANAALKEAQERIAEVERERDDAEADARRYWLIKNWPATACNDLALRQWLWSRPFGSGEETNDRIDAAINKETQR